MSMVQKAFKYRFYPTPKQIQQLNIEFGHARFVWNWALDMRIKAYKRREEKLNNVSISKVLTKLKQSSRYRWLQDGSSTCAIQRLRDLDAAFINFFEGRAKYPCFKKKCSAQSVRYQLDTRFNNKEFINGASLVLPKIGSVKIKITRRPSSNPKMATVSRDSAGRYFVSIVTEEPVEKLKPINKQIGVDMGVADIVVCSDGFKSGSPKHYRKHEKQLAKAQRVFSRKTKGSNRREKQRVKVAKLHAKIKDSRRDFLHNLSSKLINENQVIAIEDLNVKGMVKNRRLSKSISDIGMHELRRQLEYKADWYGRDIIVIDRWTPTSKVCSSCGSVVDNMSLSVREWTCKDCGEHHDRDINAAINILHTAMGAEINARGELPSRAA